MRTMLVCWVLVVLNGHTTAIQSESLPSKLTNGDLEIDLREAGAGWFAPDPGTKAGFTVATVDDRPHGGKRCVLIAKDKAAEGDVFGNLMQTLDARDYRGRWIRLRAWVRTELRGQGNRAQLWCRVDRKEGALGFTDNMADRPIMDRDWIEVEILGEVASDAEKLSVGLMLFGKGQAWLDSVSLEIVDAPRLEPARRLEGRALGNIIAFTRLLGYVRHFHPSDEAAAINWDRFAVEGLPSVETARDAAELAGALHKLFAPIAPAVIIHATGMHPEAIVAVEASEVVTWRHRGWGGGTTRSIYSSKRVRRERVDGKLPEGVPDPRAPFEADLGAGVSCHIPLAVFADERGTLPRGTAPKPASSPLGSARDRWTRLAAVSLAWNVFQHFYPYFDVVGADWPGALRRALSSAATDPDEKAFLITLRRLVAELKDGHGGVRHPTAAAGAMLPFAWAWVENQLVITHAPKDGPGDLRQGDIVERIDGRPAVEVIKERESLISSATPQWARHEALRMLAAGSLDSDVAIQVKSGSAAPREIRIRRVSGPPVEEPRPPMIHEVRDGLFYVDIDRISDLEFSKALPRLGKAKGIVFDLRGYPGDVSTIILAHLIDEPVSSAQWQVPIVSRPDREGMKFSGEGWKVQPAKPRLSGKAAFVTDGRAISYAETYLGIVEHYKLAAIVGGPTAGTNGNVISFRVPGGYTIYWTGMKVLKHDGSRHHGVGIQPTIPVSRTLKGIGEGRDELLERAIEEVGR